jgi:hypothetical protein
MIIETFLLRGRGDRTKTLFAAGKVVLIRIGPTTAL